MGEKVVGYVRVRERLRLVGGKGFGPTPSLRATPPEGIFPGCVALWDWERSPLSSSPEVDPLWRGARRVGWVGNVRYRPKSHSYAHTVGIRRRVVL